jgi:transcriptional regulator with XRE-family HTH domain
LRGLLRLGSGVRLDWHIGDVVRKLRELRKWNQGRLAKAAGINKGTVVSIEANANVKRDSMEAVARGLGMSLGEIYALVPTPTETQRADRPSSATVGRQFPYDGPDRRREDLGPPPGLPERRHQA